MTRLIGISGSLRSGSFNSALLRAATEVLPAGATLETASIREIPLYDGDVEARGFPPAVASLKQQIAAAQGLLIVTPEYNHSIPGVLKNAIDWLSRNSKESPDVFTGKAVAIIGASPSGFGTMLSQNAWWSVLHTLKTLPWFGSAVLVSKAHEKFSADGRLQDEATRKQLTEFMAGYVQFVRAHASGKDS